MDDDLALAFAKLDIQAAAFLAHRAPKLARKGPISINLEDADGYAVADRAFTCLQSRIFTFIRTKADPFKYRRVAVSLPPSLYAEVKILQDDLERFRSLYLPAETIDEAVIAKLPYRDQILCTAHLIMSVLLSTCLYLDEGVYDIFYTDFVTIINVAENIINAVGGSSGGIKEFHLDMAILYPVYKTAQMCRCPLLRRRAMELMDNISFDEGVWDAQSGKRYIGILMRLEEEGLEFEESDVRTLGPSIIPQSRRIRPLDVQPEASERYWTVFYRYNPGNGQWDDPVETVLW